MRPVVCPACGGSRTQPFTSRQIACGSCSGRGFRYVEGQDEWERYRAHYGIEITPQRLAMEEALDGEGLGAN